MTVAAPADVVFPLLCPVREYDWIPEWECEMVHSESGVAEMGCVFLTDFEGRGPETWMVTRYDPPVLIEFCRVAGATRACHLQVGVEDQGDGTSTLTWTYTHTGVDEAGRKWVEGYTPECFHAEMADLENRLHRYLEP
jgi:Polyketide cyclase / dehydrase and lipid transport